MTKLEILRWKKKKWNTYFLLPPIIRKFTTNSKLNTYKRHLKKNDISGLEWISNIFNRKNQQHGMKIEQDKKKTVSFHTVKTTKAFWCLSKHTVKLFIHGRWMVENYSKYPTASLNLISREIQTQQPEIKVNNLRLWFTGCICIVALKWKTNIWMYIIKRTYMHCHSKVKK